MMEPMRGNEMDHFVLLMHGVDSHGLSKIGISFERNKVSLHPSNIFIGLVLVGKIY